MLCEAVFELISGHIDGMNTPAEEAALQAHLSECEACRRTLETLTAVDFQTGQLRKEAPPKLKSRIMEEISEEANAPKAKRRKGWFASFAAVGFAAAVLALLMSTGVIPLPKFGSNYAAEKLPEPVYEDHADEAAAEGEAVVAAAEAEAPDAAPAEEPAYAEEVAAEEVAAAQEETVPVQTEAGFWEETDGFQEAEPEMPGNNTMRSGVRAAGETAQVYAYCEELSLRHTAPVLLLYGCDDTLPEALEILSPELSELLKDAERHELNGKLVLETDVDTACALAEWLYAVLLRDERIPPDEDTVEALERIAGYDPDGDCLSRAAALPEDEALAMLRELYTALYGDVGGLRLYYPEEDYEPSPGDTVYIVLLTPPVS